MVVLQTLFTCSTTFNSHNKFERRSHRQAFARVALSLTVSVPVAYLVFGLLPWSEIAPHSLQVSVLLLLCFLLLARGLVNQRQASALFVPA